jgi:hypothetical protein
MNNMDKKSCNNCGADNKMNSRYCSQCGHEMPKNETSSNISLNESKVAKSNDNKIRNSIIGIVVGGLVYFAVQHFLLKPPSIDKEIMGVASELNKSCPIMIDRETRLDNAVAMPDKVFQYNYTLINLDKSEVIIDTLKKYVEPGIINNVKTNPDLKFYRDNKITMNYYYRDKDGEFVYKLSVTPDMYK